MAYLDSGTLARTSPIYDRVKRVIPPPEWATFTQIDATWYTDKAAARAAVDAAKPPA